MSTDSNDRRATGPHPAGGRHRRATIGVLAAVGLVGGLAVTACGSPSQSAAPSAPIRSAGPAPTAIPAAPITVAHGRTSRTPWPAPASATDAVHRAGLPMLGAEGSAEHIHVHLDVLVDGQPVTVPALVGIDETALAISPLHTHDPSGVIHIESPAIAPFSLAEFCTEWDVALDATHLGGYAVGNGNELRAYVNGKPVAGDPGAITFAAHDEIALVYGPAGQQVSVPASYAWPRGL